MFISLALHSGNRSSIFSIHGTRSDWHNLTFETRSPKYVHGTSVIGHGRHPSTTSKAGSWHWIGITQLFNRFVCSPEASQKHFLISLVIDSSSVGRIKRATSSVYSEIPWTPAWWRGWSSPLFLALVNKLFKTTVIMNNVGDKGSPRRSPRWCRIYSPGS